MVEVEQQIQVIHSSVIHEGDTQKANEKLRQIVAAEGLGVAILVAWQHGLHNKHIPTSFDSEPESSSSWSVRTAPESDDCPYLFVHVPVRQFRRDTDKLVEYGILDKNANPLHFVYHEDGLIGRFSFRETQRHGLDSEDIDDILQSLANQGILVRANVENRQIQFKDIAAKRRIEQSNDRIYVRVDHRELTRTNAILPQWCDSKKTWDYVIQNLRFRFACNYCSVQALSPKEVTINSASTSSGASAPNSTTVRNYQFGFTFSPVGEPARVCHFLGWDFPFINDLVMNMEPQTYSFSDLIRLVRSINRDIARFCERYNIRNPGEAVSGGCNHWAGNSIYHQHYQFFRIPSLPLMAAPHHRTVVTHQGVEVIRMSWLAPAFLIRATDGGTDNDVMRIADLVAREWQALNRNEDWTYGNGISIRNHTQNIFVTAHGDQLNAVFVPRYRSKVSTADAGIRKMNAGMLEMMGYFVIDDPGDFTAIEKMSASERKKLADRWLGELSPDPAMIDEFEDSLVTCLDNTVRAVVESIDELPYERGDRLREQARSIALDIQTEALTPKQRGHLYRKLVWSLIESTSEAVED